MTPPGYVVGHFRLQISVHMAKNVNFFFKRMACYLQKIGLSFEAYLLAVAQGTIAIDHYIVGAIEHMWNLSISIISPCYATEWKIYHDCADANIVVVSNGQQFGAKENSATHFSPTKKTSKFWKKIGHDITELNIQTVSGQTQGKKSATKTFLLDEAEHIMRQHYFLTTKMKGLRNKLNECEKAFEEIEDELCEMKMNKESFHHFHAYFGHLSEDERKNPIDIAQFFATNIEHEKQRVADESGEFRSMDTHKRI